MMPFRLEHGEIAGTGCWPAPLHREAPGKPPGQLLHRPRRFPKPQPVWHSPGRRAQAHPKGRLPQGGIGPCSPGKGIRFEQGITPAWPGRFHGTDIPAASRPALVCAALPRIAIDYDAEVMPLTPSGNVTFPTAVPTIASRDTKKRATSRAERSLPSRPPPYRASLRRLCPVIVRTSRVRRGQPSERLAPPAGHL